MSSSIRLLADITSSALRLDVVFVMFPLGGVDPEKDSEDGFGLVGLEVVEFCLALLVEFAACFELTVPVELGLSPETEAGLAVVFFVVDAFFGLGGGGRRGLSMLSIV